MATHKLTAQQVKGAQPQAKAYKLFDGGGLYVAVLPSGVKSWRWQYRAGGRQQTATLGQWPAMSLAAARQARADAAQALAQGQRPVGRREAVRPRFSALAAEYWAARRDISGGYRHNALAALERHAYPLIGDKAVDTISRDDCMAVLRAMSEAGLLSYLRKVKRWAGEVFEYAIEHGHCEVNPLARIRTEVAFPSRAPEGHAALPLADVPAFWARLAVEGNLLSALACRMLAFTWSRTGELRAMRWSEIDGDVWRIPKERTKRRRDHLVPLSAQAVAVLEHLRVRRVSDFVFPNDRRPLDRPMSENSILYLIGRMGYGGRMTGHGWRSVGSTWANEAGYRADVIERQLAHEPADPVRGAYNRAEYMPERRAMLQAFADWLTTG